MSIAKKLMTVGAEKDVYADDVFSTYLYTGNGAKQSIVNGINLGDFGGGTSTEFDGESDYLSRSSDFIGNSDPAAVTISFWAFLAKEDIQARVYSVGNTYVILDPGAQVDGAVLNVYLNDGLGSAGSNQFSLRTLNRLDIPYGQWNHILVSLHKQTGQYSIYVNDTAVPSSQIANDYTNNNLADFTQSTHTVMAQNNGTVEGKGKFAHLYMDYTYRDLSNYLNRRPFITVDGGSTPPSTLAALSPIMYLPMVSGYAVGENLGTGGDFDVNGSPEIVDAGTEYVAGSGKGGLVWLKGRSKTSFDHILVDTERGVNKVLKCNTTDAEITKDCLTSFNSDGFSLGNSLGFENDFGTDFASWTFRKQKNFFDVVTYTGTGGDHAGVPHGLGIEPGLIILKIVSDSSSWQVFHRDRHDSTMLLLNLSDAEQGNNGLAKVDGSMYHPDVFYPTSISNTLGEEYVAYVFAHDDSDESMIKCGSYTGNQTAGNEVDLGFEPQFVLIKAASGAGEWYMFDTMRGIVTGGFDPFLRANMSTPESASSEQLEVNPTGFSLSADINVNTSGTTYIYMAIRRPNKPAEEFEPEELFAVTPATDTSPRYVSGFPVDMGIRRFVTDSSGNYIHSRLTGNVKLWTNTTGQEAASNDAWMDYNNGMTDPDYVSPDANRLAWMWRRAPGFMDVVTYDGDGQEGRELVHSLGVAPEMMWIKRRNESYNWIAWADSLEANEHLYLNDLASKDNNFDFLSNTRPTESAVTLSSDFGVNSSGNTYIAYLFASVPGISKVGSYVGNGSNDGPTVECGFVPRMLLVKNMDGNGAWELMDSVRGFNNIISLNNENVQLFDSLVVATATGFKVTNGASNVNTTGQNYLFYAIA